jgi:hypothetical protein
MHRAAETRERTSSEKTKQEISGKNERREEALHGLRREIKDEPTPRAPPLNRAPAQCAGAPTRLTAACQGAVQTPSGRAAGREKDLKNDFHENGPRPAHRHGFARRGDRFVRRRRVR